MKLYEKVAREMFRIEHPRSDWIAHPNYKQQEAQAYLQMSAKVLINRINEWCGTFLEPDLELGSDDPTDLNFRKRIGGLALIKHIQEALGTEETGGALVDIARNAHLAELREATRSRKSALDQSMSDTPFKGR